MIWEGHLSQRSQTTMRSLTKFFPINVIWFPPPPKKEEETGSLNYFVRQTLGDLRWIDSMGLNRSNMRLSLSYLIHPLGNLQYNLITLHYVADKQFQTINNELFYVHHIEN